MKTTAKLTLSSKLTLTKETVKSFHVQTGIRTGGAPLKVSDRHEHHHLQVAQQVPGVGAPPS